MLRSIDFLRFYLALYVCFHHASYLVWGHSAFASILNPSSWPATWGDYPLLWWSTLYWEEAVHLFYILSGLCIHCAVARKSEFGFQQFDLKDYTKRRLWRIVPAAWVALGITVVVDMIGRSMNASYYQLLLSLQGDVWSLKTFIGNLLFLQEDSVIMPYGTIKPLWTLHCEMVYYLIYPAILWFVCKSAPKKRVFRLLVLHIVAIGFLFANRVVHMPTALREYHFWIGGAIVAELFFHHKLRISGWWLPVGLALILSETTFAAATWDNFLPGAAQTAIALVAKLLGGELILLSLFSLAEKRPNVDALLGKVTPHHNFSYSLYVIHFPVIMLFGAIVFRPQFTQLPQQPWLLIPAVGLAILCGWALYHLVEKRFLHQKKLSVAPEQSLALSQPVKVPQ